MSAAVSNLPQGKQTTLGLYITSREAYERWKAEPDKVKIIDVRTPEEYLFVGYPTMTLLPDFVDRVKQAAGPDDTLLVMCRSGGRSAIAVNLLAKAGLTKVHNIVDGMEGDAVTDPDSVFVGQRLKNGWKNSGCPWTYELTPERMLLPTGRT